MCFRLVRLPLRPCARGPRPANEALVASVVKYGTKGTRVCHFGPDRSCIYDYQGCCNGSLTFTIGVGFPICCLGNRRAAYLCMRIGLVPMPRVQVPCPGGLLGCFAAVLQQTPPAKTCIHTRLLSVEPHQQAPFCSMRMLHIRSWIWPQCATRANWRRGGMPIAALLCRCEPDCGWHGRGFTGFSPRVANQLNPSISMDLYSESMGQQLSGP